MANAYKYQWTPDEAIERLYQKGFMDGNNGGFLQTLIDNTLEIEANRFFWQEHFVVEGNEYDIDLADTKKNPAWTVRQKVNRIVPMADAMAPLSETAQLDTEGWEEKTGSIYQYGKGLFETSMSKLELQARLREMNPQDQNLVTGFVKGVADLVKTHNYRLSYMAAQALSYGGAYSNTNRISFNGSTGNITSTLGFSGVNTLQSSYIPLANFKTAGTKVWSDSTCDIPTQMQKIEQDFKAANNLPEDFPMEWDIPYSMLTSVLLNNAAFVAEVNRWIAMYGVSNNRVVIIDANGTPSNQSSISWENIVAYSQSPISKIAPIRVVKQAAKVQDITTVSDVSGWKPNAAVLRPLGTAGVVVHAKTADVKLMQSGEVNSNIQFSLAKVQNFLYVINKVTPNGMLKSYHTDIIGRYAPVLNESLYHVVVDTATADS